LAYDRGGAGPPLVLLHPLGADRHVWAPVLPRLAVRRDVLALDLPGFGASPALSGVTPDPRALAAAVVVLPAGMSAERFQRIEREARDRFGVDEFRPGQRALIEAVAASGAKPLLIDCSTIDVESARAVEAAARAPSRYFASAGCYRRSVGQWRPVR